MNSFYGRVFPPFAPFDNIECWNNFICLESGKKSRRKNSFDFGETFVKNTRTKNCEEIFSFLFLIRALK